MANLKHDAEFVDVYQLERHDNIDAGENGNGLANLQAKQLASRTAYLKEQLEQLPTAAVTGDYNDLKNLPALGTAAAENVDAFATAAQGVLAENALPASEKGAAEGVAELDEQGKVPVEQLPAQALTQTHEVATDNAMLALTDLTRGDIAKVLQSGASYVFVGGEAPYGMEHFLQLGSSLPPLGSAAAEEADAFATAAQGVLAENALPASEKGAPEGVATLDSSGKLSAEHLPETATRKTQIHQVADEAEQIELDDVEEGDYCLREDDGTLWLYAPSLLDDDEDDEEEPEEDDEDGPNAPMEEWLLVEDPTLKALAVLVDESGKIPADKLRLKTINGESLIGDGDLELKADGAGEDAGSGSAGWHPERQFAAYATRHWQEHEIPLMVADCVYAPELGLFVAVSNTAAVGNPNAFIMTSTDGINWELQDAPSADYRLHKVCWAADKGVFVALSNSGAPIKMLASTDGKTWTEAASFAVTSTASSPARLAYAPELGRFVAVVSGELRALYIYTSDDGLAWSRSTLISDIDVAIYGGLAWANEQARFILTGGNNGKVAWESADGIDWQKLPTSNLPFVPFTLGYSPELDSFVTNGEYAKILTSQDMITWEYHGYINTYSNTGKFTSLAWSRELGVWVAVTAGPAEGGSAIARSFDGKKWEPVGAVTRPLSAVAYASTQAQFIAFAKNEKVAMLSLG